MSAWTDTFAAAPASVLFGLATAGSAVALGTVAGLVRATGPRVAAATVRGVEEVGLAVPRFLVLLLVSAAARAAREPLGTGTLVALLALTSWMPVARMVGAEARRVLVQPWYTATIGLGVPPLRVVLRHVLPHLGPTLGAAGALTFSSALTVQAGLAWVGLGDAGVTTWGRLLGDFTVDRSGVLPPALAVALTAGLAQLVADRLTTRSTT